MTSTPHISPISIDLGAKNTGVFFMHYPAGIPLDEIEARHRSGKVYQLAQDSHTLLMANRTAKRHLRRGFDRRQMAKRLFWLIWRWHFRFPWDDGVQQTVSFLMNRRGFSFLKEEYDEEILQQFPQNAYDLLPESIKESIPANGQGGFDAESAVQEWAQNNTITEVFQTLHSHVYAYKLFNACSQFLKNNDYQETKTEKNKLGYTPKYAYEYLVNELEINALKKAHGGTFSYETKEGGAKQAKYKRADDSYNLQAFVRFEGRAAVESIMECLRAKISVKHAQDWNFTIGAFKTEKAIDNDVFSDEKKALSAHLAHFALAVHLINHQINSGARYRAKYFDEIFEVLNGNAKSYPRYLREFCELLNGNQYKYNGKALDKKMLTRLIGHVSNFELKPLRDYFNDKAHKAEDQWKAQEIAKIFHQWIWNEWRIGEKDKLKSEDGKQDYKKLRADWRAHCGVEANAKFTEESAKNVVDFWLNTCPTYTIPPYQDNNNRRPPRCQSFILNVAHLDANYPDWQKWCSTLKADEDNVQPHLGDYEQQLQNLKSGKGKEYFGSAPTGDARKDSGRRQQVHLHARVLQYIFDRVKVDDPLNLNEIYSHAKKLKQLKASGNASGKEWENAKQKLSDALQASKLPPDMKSQDDSGDFKQGTFLHLICKYYKLRQRAKEGRIFIHPCYTDNRKIGRGFEATNRMEDSGHLLTYCNHKPRLKKYQMLPDIAWLLQTHPDTVNEVVNKQAQDKHADDLSQWFDDLDEAYKKQQLGLSTNGKKAAKLQEQQRGKLAINIHNIYKFLYDEGLYDYDNDGLSTDKKAITAALKKYDAAGAEKFLGEDAKKFLGKCEEIKKVWLCFISEFYTSKKQVQEANNLRNNPAAAIYKMAQLYNIAYQDRKGNASTCAICSADNAQRMGEKADEGAKAQRLPAIKTRIINGAVKRMARILGKAIAKDKWSVIKSHLQNGDKVRVPIITESNRFEFEPSREELVKQQRTKPRKGKVIDRDNYFDVADDKENRIKKAAGEFCPYTGDKIADGEFDHIIPRSSQSGTLNDEANLIYASRKGNQDKGNSELDLSDLKSAYKQQQQLFGNKTDTEIEQWIVATIVDGNSEGFKFKFGNYRSFINLTPDQQKAFRHALFLRPGAANNLRQKVIDAINNRTRTFVNGTQRYFAEVLANELHKLAKQELSENYLKNLSFDYYGIEAFSNTHGYDVRYLRNSYAKINPAEIKPKKKGKPQDDYSHLTDAMLAFIIAADAHRNGGGLKLNIPDSMPPVPKLAEGYAGSFLDKICISTADNETRKLKREKASAKMYQHKVLFDSNPGAWHFVKLIEVATGQDVFYIKGFLCLSSLISYLQAGNSSECYGRDNMPFGEILKEKDGKKLASLYSVGSASYQFGYAGTPRSVSPKQIQHSINGKDYAITIHNIDKTKVADFLTEKFNTKTSPQQWEKQDIEVYKTLQGLWYFTKKGAHITEDTISKTKPAKTPKADQYLESIRPECKVYGALYDPSLLYAHEKLIASWKNSNENVESFLKKHFAPRAKKQAVETDSADAKIAHAKTRKEFSLPTRSAGQGYMLIRRKSVFGRVIYQCQSEKSGNQGVGRYNKSIANDELVDTLTPFYRSKNIVMLKEYKALEAALCDDARAVDTSRWYSLPVPTELESHITSIENQYISKGDSKFKVEFINTITIEGLIELMFNGFQIDEFKVGRRDERENNIEKTREYFTGNQNDMLSLDEAKQKIEQRRKELSEINSDDLTDAQKEEKAFCKKWAEIFSSVESEDTIVYKRGVGLVIR